MAGERRDGRGPGNVIPFESFKKKREPPRSPAFIRLSEDATGDIEYWVEGVNGLNALAFLQLMLYLSERTLRIYMG